MLKKLRPSFRGRPGLLEALADRHARRTAALLDRQLAAALDGYDPKTNPLGPQQAEAILLSLVRTAMAQRAVLPEQLQLQLERQNDAPHAGDQRALERLCEHSVELNLAAEEKCRAEEEYTYLHSIWEKVQASAYEAQITPSADELKPIPQTDLWASLTPYAAKGASPCEV